MFRRLRHVSALVVAGGAVLVAGCNVQLSLGSEAKDQWQRHYTLARGGTLEIRNTNGLIHIEPGEGDAVDVTADRLVKASTDQAAKDGLAAFEIQESVSPDHILLDGTGRNGGINISFNMSRRIDYRVRVPEWANVVLTSTNGEIQVGPKLTGTMRAETTNGRIKGTGLENSVKASTTNGTINLDVAKLGEDGISGETTNGTVDVTVPAASAARLSVRVTNGAIRTEGLNNLTYSEQSRRRVEATIGDGGPAIKLETTNGAVTVRGR